VSFQAWRRSGKARRDFRIGIKPNIMTAAFSEEQDPPDAPVSKTISSAKAWPSTKAP